MATYINGKPGLVTELLKQRTVLTDRLQNDVALLTAGRRPVLNKVERENMLGQVTTYTLVINWLESSDVHVLSEAEFAATFGGDEPLLKLAQV